MSKIVRGCRVHVVNDWFPPEAKKAYAVVDNFQKNGTMEYAKLRWVGKMADLLTAEYGILFPLDELRVV